MDLNFWKISSIHICQNQYRNFGEGGIFPLGHGSGNICISLWEETERAQPVLMPTFFLFFYDFCTNRKGILRCKKVYFFANLPEIRFSFSPGPLAGLCFFRQEIGRTGKFLTFLHFGSIHFALPCDILHLKKGGWQFC